MFYLGFVSHMVFYYSQLNLAIVEQMQSWTICKQKNMAMFQ
jgi:hypothetical protein